MEIIMSKFKCFGVFLLLIISSLFNLAPIYSNGGTIDSSTLASSGNIQLQKTGNVDLISEKLFIMPVGNYVGVHIVYELNCREDNKTVAYGFPFKNEFEYDIFRSFEDSSANLIRYFSMKINGSNVKLNEKINKVKSVKFNESNEPVQYDEEKWYFSQLLLQKGINIIEINYSAKSSFEDEGTSKSEEISYGARVFRYNFKPAAGWGEGIVDKLEVSIDTSLVYNVKINGMEGLNGGENRYYALIGKADLLKIHDLEIDYNASGYQWYNEKEITSKNTPARVLKITASSCLKGDYLPENLIDGKYTTTWSEGVDNNGIDEWIEVEFRKGTSVGTIAITNGFMKNRELYRKNSRVKKIQCDISATMKDDNSRNISFSKNVNLYDFDMGYIRENNYPDKLSDIDKYTIEPLVTPEDFAGKYEITKIRLTIKEVYPGTVFSDTCITELFAF